jgi:hypothetical protein
MTINPAKIPTSPASQFSNQALTTRWFHHKLNQKILLIVLLYRHYTLPEDLAQGGVIIRLMMVKLLWTFIEKT